MGYKWRFYHELYDHKFDEEELNNLALDSSYSSICDSLIQTINLRIAQADMKPEGLEDKLKMLNLCQGLQT